MKKKFLYKNPTNPTVDNAAGTIFFNKQAKTISVGGDQMYSVFRMAHTAQPTLSFTNVDPGTLVSYVTSSNGVVYKQFLTNNGLLDSAKVGTPETIIRWNDRNSNLEYIYRYYYDDISGLIDTAKTQYSSAGYVEFSNYQIAPTMTIDNFAINDTNSNTIYLASSDYGNIGYVNKTASTLEIFNELNELGFVSNYDVNVTISWDSSNPDYIQISDNNSEYYQDVEGDLSDLHLALNINSLIPEGTELGSWTFSVDISNNVSSNYISGDVYDSSHTTNYGSILPTVNDMPFKVNAYKATLCITGEDDVDSYLDVYVIQDYFTTSTIDALNLLMGINMNLDEYNVPMGDMEMTVTFTDDEDQTALGGTVPAPTEENTVLCSDGTWKPLSASDVWDEYEE